MKPEIVYFDLPQLYATRKELYSRRVLDLYNNFKKSAGQVPFRWSKPEEYEVFLQDQLSRGMHLGLLVAKEPNVPLAIGLTLLGVTAGQATVKDGAPLAVIEHHHVETQGLLAPSAIEDAGELMLCNFMLYALQVLQWRGDAQDGVIALRLSGHGLTVCMRFDVETQRFVALR